MTTGDPYLVAGGLYFIASLITGTALIHWQMKGRLVRDALLWLRSGSWLFVLSGIARAVLRPDRIDPLDVIGLAVGVALLVLVTFRHEEQRR